MSCSKAKIAKPFRQILYVFLSLSLQPGEDSTTLWLSAVENVKIEGVEG